MFKPSGYPFASKLRNDIVFAIIVLLVGSIIGFIVLPFVISNFEQKLLLKKTKPTGRLTINTTVGFGAKNSVGWS